MNIQSREGFPYGPVLLEGIKPVTNSEGHLEAITLDHTVTEWLWSALGNVMNITETNSRPEEIYEGITALWPRQNGDLRDGLLEKNSQYREEGTFQSEVPLELLDEVTTYLLGTVATENNRKTTENYIVDSLNYFTDTSRRDEVIKNRLAVRALAIDASDIIQYHLRKESTEEK